MCKDRRRRESGGEVNGCAVLGQDTDRVSQGQ